MRVVFGVLAVVEEHLQSLARTEPEVMAAGRTNVQIGFKIIAIDRRRAILVFAFDEDAFHLDCAFFGRSQGAYFVGFALEPSHR
jgi:hypothetical protein